MLADQIAIARYHNPLGEIWAMDVGDPVGATAATGGWTILGTATSSGTLVRFIAGERYNIGVSLGDTAAVVAANPRRRDRQGLHPSSTAAWARRSLLSSTVPRPVRWC